MKGTCRAAVLTAPEKIRLENIPIPEILPNEVLIQVKACALCGSDLHAYMGKHPRITFPRIMGHEFSGIIVEKGEKVSGWEIGQRVCCEPGLSCEKCEYCRQGRRNLCLAQNVMGFNVDGAYCEYVKIHQANLYLLPDSVPFEEASVIQTMSVAYNGVKRRGEVMIQDKVLIFGCGPIGFCALAIAKASGAEVYVVDTLDYRLDIGKSMGADYTFNATKVDVVKNILDLTQGRGVDKVIEAVGGEQDVTLGQATQVVKRAGLIVVVGTFSNNRATLRITEFKARELELRGSQGDVDAFPDCIQLIASGKIDLKKIISHYIHLDQVEDGLKMMKDKNEKVMKVIVRF